MKHYDPNGSYYDSESEAYSEFLKGVEPKYKANLPIWKGAFSIIVFGLCVYYWDLICEVVSKMF